VNDPGTSLASTSATSVRIRSNLILYAIVLVVLLWLVFYPNAFIFIQSFVRAGQWTLSNYREFFSTASELEALWNSLWISLWSVLLSALIGTPLAFLFHRFDFPGRAIFAALASLPVLLPPLVGVISFLFLYGESGIFTRGLQHWLGWKEPLFSLRGAGAILFVHAYTMYVYFYLFVSAGLKRFDFTLIEAARSLGASPVRAFYSVTLRQLTPSLAGASLLTFMTSMASFSAPYIFGGGTRVLALQIYNSKLNGDLEMALVETVILTLASIVVLALLQRYEGVSKYRATGKGGLQPLTVVTHPAKRFLAGATGVLAVLFLLLPHLTLILISFAKDGTWTMEILPPQYTLENYTRLLSSSQFLEPVINSLQMATLATLANFVFAMLAGYLVVRQRVPGRMLLSSLILLPWALPGTVLALSLASTFNRQEIWQARVVLVGTYWLLPLAYFIRNIPVVVRAVQASFEQFDTSLDEAARSLGGSWFYSMRRVVLPMVLPGALAGSMLAFVAALGEFVTSIVIYTIHNRPISIEILAQLRQFNFGSAAAYGVFLVVLIGAVFVISERYLSETGLAREKLAQ
jgi:iron(III) transport system permease protein